MLNKKIPTFIGIIILVAGFLAVLFGLTQVQTIVSKATPFNIPRGITFSNFRNSSFSLSYLTDEGMVGSVIVNQSSFFRDDRDITTKSSNKYLSHHITILADATQKETILTILSGDAQYGTLHKSTYTSFTIPDSDVCEIKTVPGILSICYPIRVKLPSVLTNQPAFIQPLNGVVYENNNIKPLTDGVVYFSLPNSSIETTTLRDNGTWILPLEYLRDKTLVSYYSDFSSKISFNLEIRSGKSLLSISCPLKKNEPYALPAFFMGKKPLCQIPQ